MRNFRNKIPVEYELVALGIKPTNYKRTLKIKKNSSDSVDSTIYTSDKNKFNLL